MCVRSTIFNVPHLQAMGNRSAAGDVVFSSLAKTEHSAEKEKSKNRRHAGSGVSLIRFGGSCVCGGVGGGAGRQAGKQARLRKKEKGK